MIPSVIPPSASATRHLRPRSTPVKAGDQVPAESATRRSSDGPTTSIKDTAIIDHQHRRIVDYTDSDLAFAGDLLEQAGHDSLPIQPKTDQAFCNRIDDLRHRTDPGEDIAATSARLLRTRFSGHIGTDDASGTDLFRQRLARLRQQNQGAWLSDAIRRYFGQALIGSPSLGCHRSKYRLDLFLRDRKRDLVQPRKPPFQDR